MSAPRVSCSCRPTALPSCFDRNAFSGLASLAGLADEVEAHLKDRQVVLCPCHAAHVTPSHGCRSTDMPLTAALVVVPVSNVVLPAPPPAATCFTPIQTSQARRPAARGIAARFYCGLCVKVYFVLLYLSCEPHGFVGVPEHSRLGCSPSTWTGPRLLRPGLPSLRSKQGP